MFRVNQKIGGYTLIRKIGQGGFGEVWLAEKRSEFITRQVAIKLPLDEQVDKEAIRREAQFWQQASGHPNVLPIIDADVYDGQTAIVSEYADGGSLADKLKREGKLSVTDAVAMTVGVLQGLEYLHGKRIIHRDIKPANILLQGNTPRLADFGISRAMQTSVVSSVVIGTSAYMSPEAFDGKRTPQTDIWSVGIVLCQLLTNKLPFPQENPSERMFAIVTKDFAPLPNEIPQNVRNVIAKALAKQPENRYQSAREMRVALDSETEVATPLDETYLLPTVVDAAPMLLPTTTPAPMPLPKPTKTLPVTPEKRLYTAGLKGLFVLWILLISVWSIFWIPELVRQVWNAKGSSDIVAAIMNPLIVITILILPWIVTFPVRWLANWIRFGERNPPSQFDIIDMASWFYNWVGSGKRKPD